VGAEGQVRQGVPVLAVVSLVGGLGALAFLPAGEGLAPFALVLAIAGLVCGGLAVNRGEAGVMGWAGVTVSAVLTFVFAVVVLA
jgi:hypothetical protein